MGTERNPGVTPSANPGAATAESDVSSAAEQVPEIVDVFAPGELTSPAGRRTTNRDAATLDESPAVSRPYAELPPLVRADVEGRGTQGEAPTQTSTAPLPPKSEQPHPSPQSTMLTPGGERRVRAKARQEQRLERIREIDSRIRMRAAKILDSYMFCDAVDDAGNPVDGRVLPKWARKQVLRDGRQTKKNQPGYIADAMRICEWHTRKEAGQDKPAPTLNVGTVYVQQNVVYPVVDDEE